MGILNDREIRRLAQEKGFITPFKDYGDDDIRYQAISSGLSSFGYDVRLGNKFKVFRQGAPLEGYSDKLIDPKDFNDYDLTDDLTVDADHLDIRPHGFVLGYTLERFVLPRDVVGRAMGKSTYARCGLIVTPTPLEPGWEGHVTVEIGNWTDFPARVYIGEGICQFQFEQGGQPDVTYDMRSGKYQNQQAEPVPAKGG